LSYSLNGFNRIFTVFLDTRRDRQSERIEENIVARNAVLNRLFIRTTSDLDLIIERPGHPVFIDQTDDNSGSEALGKIEDFKESLFAVLVIC